MYICCYHSVIFTHVSQKTKIQWMSEIFRNIFRLWSRVFEFFSPNFHAFPYQSQIVETTFDRPDRPTKWKNGTTTISYNGRRRAPPPEEEKKMIFINNNAFSYVLFWFVLVDYSYLLRVVICFRSTRSIAIAPSYFLQMCGFFVCFFFY